MCDRYAVEGSCDNIADGYQATFLGELPMRDDILPRALAPSLLCSRHGERELQPMQFGTASPDAETPSFAKCTHHNTRIEEPTKWPWLDAIEKNRCLIPVAEFRQPCYWGDTQGTEVYFGRADHQRLHVAGIYRLWHSPDKSEQRYMMSMLMKPAGAYLMDHGHHRQPILLAQQAIDDWINPQRISCEQAVQLLRDNLEEPELTHRRARALDEGWKKRRKGKARARSKQLAAIENCPNPCGF